MAEATKPAYNPANSTTVAGKDELLIKNAKMGLFCAAPALIEAFDRAKMQATVRPAFMAKKSNGENIAQDLLYNVPVRFGGGGGFSASLPLTKGDTGWLIFCDRDLSAFKATRAVSPCNTNRMHAQEDAFFLPDAMQTAQIAAGDASKAVFQTLDGSVKISVSASGVEVLGDVSVTGNITATGNVAVTGDISATGNITATGTVTGTVDVIGGGISLKNHVHGGVTGGNSTTGVPQ